MHQCILGLSCISMKDDNAGLFLSYQIFIHISQLSTFCSQKKIAALSCDCCLLSPYVIWNYFFRPRFCEFLNGKNISILFFQMLVVCIFIIFFFFGFMSCLINYKFVKCFTKHYTAVIISESKIFDRHSWNQSGWLVE